MRQDEKAALYITYMALSPLAIIQRYRFTISAQLQPELVDDSRNCIVAASQVLWHLRRGEHFCFVEIYLFYFGSWRFVPFSNFSNNSCDHKDGPTKMRSFDLNEGFDPFLLNIILTLRL